MEAQEHSAGGTADYEYDRDTRVERTGEGRWRAKVTPRWSIGPYPNGGYVLAVAMQAVAAELPHPHPFAVSAHFLRPTAHAPVDIEVERIRAGRGHSTAEARLIQDGSERLRALATFGDLSAASGANVVTATAPQMPPPEECLGRRDDDTVMPNGLQASIRDRMDLRLVPETASALLGRPRGVGEIGGWMRFADGRPVDALSLVLLCDACPPAAFDLVERPGWVPTIEYTVLVRGVPAPGWLRCWFRTRFVVDGYIEEDGELWDSTGRLVAMSRQLARINPQ
jgi:acyl-CoA thioesterase